MDDENAAPREACESATDIRSRFPALSLERADPQAPLLVPEIGPEHPLYPLAAWIYHHAKELEEGYSRSLYVALERAWPRARGRPRTRRAPKLVVSLLKEAGVPTKVIARKLNRSPGDIDNLAREARQARDHLARAGRRSRREGVQVVAENSAVPYDPATWVGEQFARGEDATYDGLAPELAKAEELARELGFASLEELTQRGYGASKRATDS